MRNLQTAMALATLVMSSCTGVVSVDQLAPALTEVTSFGSNPGQLRMYSYVPAAMPDAAPLVVSLHGCTQSASAYVNAGWNELADLAKFYVVYAEQPSSNNAEDCFDWYTSSDITRGSGEALSIKQMVDAMKAKVSVDASRVFVTGLSAGGAMTTVMLATYPDVFAGGAVMSGLPYGCASSQTDAYSCMSPGATKSASAWGDLVRKANAGYAGPYPRLSVWHGTDDHTVAPANEAALVAQWTELHGLPQTPTATNSIGAATHAVYADAQGNVAVESYLIAKMGHGTALEVGFAPAGGCGQAGAFLLDVGICSTYWAAAFFGLVAPAAVADGGDTRDLSETAADLGPSAPGGGGGASGGGIGGQPRGCSCALNGRAFDEGSSPLALLIAICAAALVRLGRQRC